MKFIMSGLLAIINLRGSVKKYIYLETNKCSKCLLFEWIHWIMYTQTVPNNFENFLRSAWSVFSSGKTVVLSAPQMKVQLILSPNWNIVNNEPVPKHAD